MLLLRIATARRQRAQPHVTADHHCAAASLCVGCVGLPPHPQPSTLACVPGHGASARVLSSTHTPDKRCPSTRRSTRVHYATCVLLSYPACPRHPALTSPGPPERRGAGRHRHPERREWPDPPHGGCHRHHGRAAARRQSQVQPLLRWVVMTVLWVVQVVICLQLRWCVATQEG